MLTILSELRRHYDPINGVLTDTDFKIIYVAPMKALASEMVENFSRRLSSLGLQVKELTGDMQLTKSEIERTHMIITTPEKWDVITRKSTGDTKFVTSVKLLIIDEIHLLHEDRGPVIEALVARTLRQVEQTQESLRIIGLSATLPNYVDIARFLFVNLMTGLFFFDNRFRPVPLAQTFIGVKGANKMAITKNLDDICYEKVLEQVKLGRKQVRKTSLHKRRIYWFFVFLFSRFLFLFMHVMQQFEQHFNYLNMHVIVAIWNISYIKMKRVKKMEFNIKKLADILLIQNMLNYVIYFQTVLVFIMPAC